MHKPTAAGIKRTAHLNTACIIKLLLLPANVLDALLLLRLMQHTCKSDALLLMNFVFLPGAKTQDQSHPAF